MGPQEGGSVGPYSVLAVFKMQRKSKQELVLLKGIHNNNLNHLRQNIFFYVLVGTTSPEHLAVLLVVPGGTKLILLKDIP